MARQSHNIDSQLEAEIRSLKLRLAVLNKKEFVLGAFVALSDELRGEEGKPWRELEAELKLGRI
jgi:hypothetical protein